MQNTVTNADKELGLSEIYVKEEITDEMESNIPGQRQEQIVCTQPYYQSSATFTMAENLNDHKDIHKGEKS